MDQKPSVKRRKLRNFLLQPFLQIRLGLYSMVLSATFAVVVSVIVYLHMQKFFTIVLAMTDTEQEIINLLLQYLNGLVYWLVAAFVLYTVTSLILSVTYTHRLVGPTVAFIRHIKQLQEGKFHARTHLRKRDAFTDVADELNKLSENLQRTKNQRESASEQTASEGEASRVG